MQNKHIYILTSLVELLPETNKHTNTSYVILSQHKKLKKTSFWMKTLNYVNLPGLVDEYTGLDLPGLVDEDIGLDLPGL